MAPRSSYLFAILLTRFVGWCTLVETRNGICSRTKMAATTSILSLVSRHITCRHMNTDVTSGLVNAPTPTNPSFPYFPRFLSTFLLASPLPWRFLLSAALQFIPITSSSLLYLFSFFSFLSFPFPSLLFFLLLFLSFWLPPFFPCRLSYFQADFFPPLPQLVWEEPVIIATVGFVCPRRGQWPTVRTIRSRHLYSAWFRQLQISSFLFTLEERLKIHVAHFRPRSTVVIKWFPQSIRKLKKFVSRWREFNRNPEFALAPISINARLM